MCGAPGPVSRVSVRERIYGGDQLYCPCDMGLCFPDDPAEVSLLPGTYPAEFPWEGRNWTGPSDTQLPIGPPFPPGRYIFEVRSTGTFGSDTGLTPFVIVARFGLELVAD
jgi:hypothetical protein